MIRASLVLSTYLLLAGVDAETVSGAAPRDALGYGAFVYSNLCWSKESGDAYGLRVSIIRYPDASGDHLLFEWSEGPLYERTGYKVRIDSEGSRISFEVNQDATMTMPDWRTYTGEISNEAVILHANDAPARIFRLSRVRDFAKENRVCP